MDILILIEDGNAEIERKLDDIAYEVMWNNDFKPIISLKVISEKKYKNALKKNYSFYRHVENDGLTL